MTEKLHRPDHDLDSGHDATMPYGTPGKVPVTARLPSRASTSIVFRVESAEAARELAGSFGPRDANGVAAGADTAVQRAAGTSGAPLPAELRDRFESTLGTDLSGVRVHTGAESAEASKAVGARAYTTGQDIHFGAGHYDPSSAFGVHLLAHEVAHTVQQAGAAPTMQHKLEVSTPGDAAEVEADRAADAMMAGLPASIAISAGGAARQVLQRDNDGAGGAGGHDAGGNDGAHGAGGGTDNTDSEFASDPVPALDVPEGSMTMVPPPPRNWAGTAAVAASPSAPWGGAPTYAEEWSAPGNLDTYRAAFNTSWSEAQSGYGALYALHKAYQGEEKAIIPLMKITESASIGAKTAHVNATDSFQGDKLAPGATKMDSDKVGPELREKIAAKTEAIDACKVALENGAGAVTKGVNGFQTANNNVSIAINDLSIIKTDQEIANLNLDAGQVKRDLEDFKAKSKATVESLKAAADVVNCWSDPTKLFGNIVSAAKQTANAGGAIADAAATSGANDQLAAIDGKIRGLTNFKASLAATNAALKINSAVAALSSALVELKAAVRTMKTAKDNYDRAYREMGTLMASAGQASGMDAKDQAALAGAVEAVPKIEAILKTIDVAVDVVDARPTGGQNLCSRTSTAPGTRPLARVGRVPLVGGRQRVGAFLSGLSMRSAAPLSIAAISLRIAISASQ